MKSNRRVDRGESWFFTFMSISIQSESIDFGSEPSMSFSTEQLFMYRYSWKVDIFLVINQDSGECILLIYKLSLWYRYIISFGSEHVMLLKSELYLPVNTQKNFHFPVYHIVDPGNIKNWSTWEICNLDEISPSNEILCCDDSRGNWNLESVNEKKSETEIWWLKIKKSWLWDLNYENRSS